MVVKKWFLSASSQEHNLGVIPGYIEEVECNKIAHILGDILVAHGQLVMYNEPGETYEQHAARALAWGADYVIAIHTNAADPTAEGMRAGCYDPADLSRPSTQFTKALFDALAPITPSLKDTMTQYRFYEIVKNICPVAYLELSFHTNLRDCRWLLDNQPLIALTIAKACLGFIGVAYTAPAPAIDPAEFAALKAERDGLIGRCDDLGQTLAEKVAILANEEKLRAEARTGWAAAMRYLN